MTHSEDDDRMMLGRIVVLPEYRHQGIGTLVVREAETWAKELGFTKVVVESRDNKIPFYEPMDYVANLNRKIEGETFISIEWKRTYKYFNYGTICNNSLRRRRNA